MDEKGVSKALTAAGFDEWAVGPLGTGEGSSAEPGTPESNAKRAESALVAVDARGCTQLMRVHDGPCDDDEEYAPGASLHEFALPHWNKNPWANGGTMMFGQKGGRSVFQACSTHAARKEGRDEDRWGRGANELPPGLTAAHDPFQCALPVSFAQAARMSSRPSPKASTRWTMCAT